MKQLIPINRQQSKNVRTAKNFVFTIAWILIIAGAACIFIALNEDKVLYPIGIGLIVFGLLQHPIGGMMQGFLLIVQKSEEEKAIIEHQYHFASQEYIDNMHKKLTKDEIDRYLSIAGKDKYDMTPQETDELKNLKSKLR